MSNVLQEIVLLIDISSGFLLYVEFGVYNRILKINKVRGSFQIQFDVLISDYDCLTSSSSLLWLTLQCVVEFTGSSFHRYVGILPKTKQKSSKLKRQHISNNTTIFRQNQLHVSVKSPPLDTVRLSHLSATCDMHE